MLQRFEAEGPLVVRGEIQVDGQKYPALRRALERGKQFMARHGLAVFAASQGATINDPEDDMGKKKAVAKSVKVAKTAAAPKAKKAKDRDPRLPAAGSTLTREYKGKTLTVLVGESDFEFNGAKYASLTALALKITGANAISGPAFFKLTEPKPTETK